MRALLLACGWWGIWGAGLNFVALGDWGGQSIIPPFTMPGQTATANGMGHVAQEISSRFVLAMGDNFYFAGIQGDEHNKRFHYTFEDVYTHPALQTPWYVIAGNHDHVGNVTAQIKYSQDSKRWKFPDFYYTWKESVESSDTNVNVTATVQFIFIDTVLLAGDSHHDPTTDTFVPAVGPANVAWAETQWQWLETQINSSTADYLWVGGHYPVWSVCSHGNTQVLVDRLKPMLEKYHVTGYISGHDHCEEFLDEGKGPVYVLTGTGDECCYAASNKDKVPTGSLKFYKALDNAGGALGGFTSFRVTPNATTIVFHSANGNVLWTAPPVHPRPQSQR